MCRCPSSTTRRRRTRRSRDGSRARHQFPEGQGRALDEEERWSFFGYKNHLGVDKAHKLIRKWDATDAAVHDSQKLDDVLDLSNTGKGVWADSAYRSVQIEAGLKAKGLQSRIHRRAARNRPLSERRNRRSTRLEGARACRARIRPPAELDGRQDRAHHRHCAGEFKIGMMNLGYNIRRLVQLERLAAVPA